MARTGRFTLDALIGEARAHVRRVTAQQAWNEVADGALIVDTRHDTHRWAHGVIAGSLHVPRTVLQWVVDPASGFQSPSITGFDQRLILMCQEGYSSSLAAYNLLRLGFHNTTDMIDGFSAWCSAGLPVQIPQATDHGVLEGRHPPEPVADDQSSRPEDHGQAAAVSAHSQGLSL